MHLQWWLKRWGRMMAATGGPVYKDVASKNLSSKYRVYGKKFLISNDQDNIKWVMQNEQNDRKLLCFKATAQAKTKNHHVWRNAERTQKKLKMIVLKRKIQITKHRK